MEKGFKVTTFSIPASAFDPVVDVKQLRLGNWLQSFIIMDDGTGHISKRCIMPFRVDLKTMEILSDSQGRHFATMEPISLSPELLEKAGFEMMPNSFMASKVIRAGFRIGYHNGNASECSLFQHGIEFPLAAGQVKYLHSLQNLYFALSGEELEINL